MSSLSPTQNSSDVLVLLLLMGSAQVFITMRITERRQVEKDKIGKAVPTTLEN